MTELTFKKHHFSLRYSTKYWRSIQLKNPACTWMIVNGKESITFVETFKVFGTIFDGGVEFDHRRVLRAYKNEWTHENCSPEWQWWNLSSVFHEILEIGARECLVQSIPRHRYRTTMDERRGIFPFLSCGGVYGQIFRYRRPGGCTSGLLKGNLSR